MAEEQKPAEDWMQRKWRPLMAMMYMFCCLSDFALFPILFTVVQFWEIQIANDAFRQWVPITLQGGGLFHVAMGAVLGVSAYGRTQEKLGGAAQNVITPTLDSTVPVIPISTPIPTPLPIAATPQITLGFGGKAAPPAAHQPEL
jgi:hypothetical protein